MKIVVSPTDRPHETFELDPHKLFNMEKKIPLELEQISVSLQRDLDQFADYIANNDLKDRINGLGDRVIFYWLRNRIMEVIKEIEKQYGK